MSDTISARVTMPGRLQAAFFDLLVHLGNQAPGEVTMVLEAGVLPINNTQPRRTGNRRQATMLPQQMQSAPTTVHDTGAVQPVTPEQPSAPPLEAWERVMLEREERGELQHEDDDTDTETQRASGAHKDPFEGRRKLYRVVRQDLQFNGVPNRVLTFLVRHGAQSAQTVQSQLRMKQKSVQSALHFLRTQGAVESIPAPATH